ncbi:uncharacterized protein LOC104862633 [Fukomys damarensis]|uniref:uncharacterized protein LOC104862633 n=1 Tax=Fukomys damarensis TaxID=885580 RepID=UPI00053F3B66|nr:uncharacterized protein LOC104862633 [Fukomys damarensis]
MELLPSTLCKCLWSRGVPGRKGLQCLQACPEGRAGDGVTAAGVLLAGHHREQVLRLGLGLPYPGPLQGRLEAGAGGRVITEVVPSLQETSSTRRAAGLVTPTLAEPDTTHRPRHSRFPTRLGPLGSLRLRSQCHQGSQGSGRRSLERTPPTLLIGRALLTSLTPERRRRGEGGPAETWGGLTLTPACGAGSPGWGLDSSASCTCARSVALASSVGLPRSWADGC